jgi:hypothetical protein
MILKRGSRFLDKIMRQQGNMIPKSGNRFSAGMVHRQEPRMIPQVEADFRTRSCGSKERDL